MEGRPLSELKLTDESAALLQLIRHMSAALDAHERTDTIKSGVKTGQPTVSVPVRMLKTQADMLKAAAYAEGRPTAAIIRDLLDMYFAVKKHNPNSRERERFWHAYLLQEPNLSDPEKNRMQNIVDALNAQDDAAAGTSS